MKRSASEPGLIQLIAEFILKSATRTKGTESPSDHKSLLSSKIMVLKLESTDSLDAKSCFPMPFDMHVFAAMLAAFTVDKLTH